MKLFYRETGDPARPPLIILHGLWGASDNWLPVARLLSANFHVLLPDLRNHGRSPHCTDHDYPAMGQDITDWIDRLQLPAEPYIAGHSMGGKVLMYLLLTQPGIAKKAAVLDIAPKTYPPNLAFGHSSLIRFMNSFPLPDYYRREDIHTAIRQQIEDEASCQLLLKNIRKTEKGFEWKIDVPAIEAHLPELLSWPLVPSLPVYPSPILFLRGELSDYIQPADIPLITSFFPLARVATIPQATHRLHADRPACVAEALQTFFLGSGELPNELTGEISNRL